MLDKTNLPVPFLVMAPDPVNAPVNSRVELVGLAVLILVTPLTAMVPEIILFVLGALVIKLLGVLIVPSVNVMLLAIFIFVPVSSIAPLARTIADAPPSPKISLLAPKLLLFVKLTIPPFVLTSTVPVKVLVPVKVNMPRPALFNVPLPLTTPLAVRRLPLALLIVLTPLVVMLLLMVFVPLTLLSSIVPLVSASALSTAEPKLAPNCRVALLTPMLLVPSESTFIICKVPPEMLVEPLKALAFATDKVPAPVLFSVMAVPLMLPVKFMVLPLPTTKPPTPVVSATVMLPLKVVLLLVVLSVIVPLTNEKAFASETSAVPIVKLLPLSMCVVAPATPSALLAFTTRLPPRM